MRELYNVCFVQSNYFVVRIVLEMTLVEAVKWCGWGAVQTDERVTKRTLPPSSPRSE